MIRGTTALWNQVREVERENADLRRQRDHERRAKELAIQEARRWARAYRGAQATVDRCLARYGLEAVLGPIGPGLRPGRRKGGRA
jgi:hypothetical protein